MGISERRMRRLMEGRGPGRPGVAEKLGELATSISEGRWCEQQGSLMRGLAFGILDRDGERYRLALAHSDRCSACRAYVASLRGLASVLPPVLMPGGLGAAVLARVGEGAGATGPTPGPRRGTGPGRRCPQRRLSAPSAAGGCSAAPARPGPAGPGAAGSSRAVPSARSWRPAACWRSAWVPAASASAASGCRRATGLAPQRSPRGAPASAVPALKARGREHRRSGRERPRSGFGAAGPRLGRRVRAASGQARAAREFGPEQALAAGSSTGGAGERIRRPGQHGVVARVRHPAAAPRGPPAGRPHTAAPAQPKGPPKRPPAPPPRAPKPSPARLRGSSPPRASGLVSLRCPTFRSPRRPTAPMSFGAFRPS